MVDIPTSTIQAHQALRWALASADYAETNNIPTCTLMLIPDTYTAPYKQLLHHPWIQHIDTRPLSELYTTSDIWLGSKQHTPSTTQKIHIIIVCNPKSKPTYFPNLQEFINIWTDYMQSLSPYWEPTFLNRPPTVKNTDIQITYPRKFKSLITLPWQPATYQCPPLPTTPTTYPCTHTAVPSSGLQVYTDGSLIKGKLSNPSQIGAAVYIPSAGMSYTINPGGQGATRTNNRAELVAIHQALTHIEYTTDLTLHTDSLCSLQLIKKMIHDPTTASRSIHSELLKSIQDHLIQRILQGAHTTLCKVRSHTGIYGNDQADILAKQAAEHPNHTRYTDNTGEIPRHNMYWPTVQPPRTPTGETPPHILAPNLTQGISSNLPTSCHIGQHPLKGIYATTWAENTPHQLPHSSNKFWTSTKIQHKTKFHILKARWGRLWNRKLAYRWKMPYANSTHPATSSSCPICHTCEDGAGHILAGCTHRTFKGMYITRHDATVRLIHKAISKGDLGSRRMIMDVGKEEDLPRGVLGKRLPAWLRPSSIPLPDWTRMRPDLVILPESESPTGKADKIIWIIELGYCSDTNHATKFVEKHAQHARLVESLEQAGYLVHYIIITIGTTGTIPTTFLDHMTKLGIARLQALKLADKVHALSIASFDAILKCRRFMETRPGVVPGD
jgi:ribonuclease HI